MQSVHRTLSGQRFVGRYLNPAAARSSGCGKACGQEVNVANRSLYVFMIENTRSRSRRKYLWSCSTVGVCLGGGR